MFNDAIQEKDNSKKGPKFEWFFECFMASQFGFEFLDKHTRSKVGEIDYYYRTKNLCGHPLWEKCPYIYVECKNWAEHISSEKMNHFLSLVEVKSIFPFCGIYITTSYFSKPALETLKSAIRRKKILVIPIDKTDFDEMIDYGIKKLMEKKCDQLMKAI